MARIGKKPGPKPKMTEDLRKQVLGAFGVGGSVADAAGLIGVSVRTLRREIAGNPEFGMGVKHARKAGKLKLIQKVANAPAWQAAAWMLERKYGREFGRKDTHEVKHSGTVKLLPMRLDGERELDAEGEDANDRGSADAEALREAGRGHSLPGPLHRN